MVILVTADNCGHCTHSRGDGLITSKKPLVSPSYIKKLIGQGTEMLNIHYHQMMATKNSIKDISRFYIKNKILYQERYNNFQDHLRLEVYQEQKNGIIRVFNDFVLDKGKKVNWKRFTSERIPIKILNYIFFFPCFIVVNKDNWKKTLIEPKEELMALTNAGYTFKDKFGNLGLRKTQQSIYGRNVDILNLLEDLKTNKVEFKPHQNDQEEKKEEKKEKEIKMADFIEYKDVIIKGYND